jgi:hypothetical protein
MHRASTYCDRIIDQSFKPNVRAQHVYAEITSQLVAAIEGNPPAGSPALAQIIPRQTMANAALPAHLCNECF